MRPLLIILPGALAIAGTLAAVGDSAAVPSTARTSASPACDTRKLTVAISTNGAGGGLTPGVAFSTRAASACRLREALTFAIRDANGQLLPFADNPVRLPLRSDRLARGRAASAMWWWQNWCGRGRRPFRYDVRLGTRTARFVEHSTPRCDGGGARASRLSLLSVCPQPENAGLLPRRGRASALEVCRLPR